MDALCPECQQAMQWQRDDQFYCPACRQGYRQQALCPQCRQPLEVLQACGAVDYLCPHGHGLISKRGVQWRYQPL